MKRRISLLLAVVMILGSFSFAFANDAMTETDAGAFLKDKGVLQGINGELKLEDKLRREDAVVMIARLHGAEEEAEAFPTEGLTFKDVKDPYYQSMISWAVANDLIEGHNAEKFGYHEDITAQHYATILLRALGYGEEVAEKAGYDKALELAAELGLLEGVKVENKTPITRGQMALMTYNALGTKMKDSEETLADKLEIEMPKPAALEVEEVKADNLKEVVVRFNQKVDAATVTDANVSVKDAKGTAALQEDGTTVVITITEPKHLTNQKAYTAVVKGVKSVDGLEIAETKVDFKAFDRTLPEVEDIVVTGPRSFELVFSEPIAEKGDVTIKQGNTKVGNKAETNDSRRVSVNVYTNLQEGKEYEVTVNGFEDFAGYKNVVNTLKFTYEKDVNPPVAEIVKAEQTYVKVKFNKPVTGLKAEQFYHTFNAWNAVGIYKDAEFKDAVDEKKSETEVFVLFHNGKEDDKSNRPLPEGDVRFGISGKDIKDNWGNALGQFETTVKVTADKAAPEVAKVEVTDDNTITVTFNKDVKFTKANVDVFDANEKKVNGLDWTVTGSGKEYEIKLIGKNMTGQDITLVLSDVTDTALVPNKMATYTEVINVTDKSPLKVNKVYYTIAKDGKKGELVVIFNKEVDGDTALNVKNYALVYDENTQVMPLSETPYFDINSARVRIPLNEKQVGVVSKHTDEKPVNLQVIGIKDLSGNQIAPVLKIVDSAIDKVTSLEVTSISAPATNKIVVELADTVNNVKEGFFKIKIGDTELTEKDFVVSPTQDGGVTVLEFVLGEDAKGNAYEFKTDLSDLTFKYNPKAETKEGKEVITDGIKNSFGTVVKTLAVKGQPVPVFNNKNIDDKVAPAMEKTTYTAKYIEIKYTELVDGNALSNGTFAVKGNTVDKVEIVGNIEDERYSDTVRITVKNDLTEAPTITQLQAVKDKAGNAYTAKDDDFKVETTEIEKGFLENAKKIEPSEENKAVYNYSFDEKNLKIEFKQAGLGSDATAKVQKAAEEVITKLLNNADEIKVTIGEKTITVTNNNKNLGELAKAILGEVTQDEFLEGETPVKVNLKLEVTKDDVIFILDNLTANFSLLKATN